MPKGDKTKLGDRMKALEALDDGVFMPRLPIVCRMDGRAFSRWTRGLGRPYDSRLSRLMVETTKLMVGETNALVGYTQSDEITLVLHAEDHDTDLWFGSRKGKIRSLLSGTTTAYFNALLPDLIGEKAFPGYRHRLDCPRSGGPATPVAPMPPPCLCGAWAETFRRHQIPTFDARAFNVPDLDEAANAILWREIDATRNSVSMAAQSLFSHNQLMHKSTADKMDMLMSRGVNWNDYPAFFRRGTYVRRVRRTVRLTDDQLSRIPPKQRVEIPDPPVVMRRTIEEVQLEPLRSYPADERVRLLFGAEMATVGEGT